MDLLANHEVLVGCYEEFVLGFLPSTKEDGTPALKPSFSNHAHSGVVKALGAGGKFMVSGGGDENVKIFNLRNRTEFGALHHHDGTFDTSKDFLQISEITVQ